MSTLHKYEYIRLKEELKEENRLIIASTLLKFSIDTNAQNVLSIASSYAHSEKFDLNNIPEDIQKVEAIRKEISEEEAEKLMAIYKEGEKTFLYYK